MEISIGHQIWKCSRSVFDGNNSGNAVPISISAGGHLANRIGEHSNARGKHLLLVETSLYRELFIRQTAPRKPVGIVTNHRKLAALPYTR